MCPPRFRVLVSDGRGFTLVELMMVIAIIAALATIAVKGFNDNRRKSYDTQVSTLARNLLTAAETELPQTAESLAGGGTPTDYPQVELNPGTYLNIVQDAADRWRFYIAHEGGQLGFYFWIPGPDCAVDVDDTAPGAGGPIPSDKIVPAPTRDDAANYDWATFRTNAGL